MTSVRLVISIDAECDKGPEWMTQYPLRFESIRKGVPEILMPLFQEHGICPTFLLSPEVIADECCADVFRNLADCELGTHLHGEFIEPEADFTAPITSTPQSAYTPEVEWQKLSNLTALFEAKFGRKPLSFRGGRFALSPNSLAYLERLGYRADSSVTPFRTNSYGGTERCNYWGAPLYPYHPCPFDPRRRGRLGLVEVPVTILIPAFARWPAFILRRMDDRVLRRARFLRRFGLDPQRKWVRPFRGTAEELISWADAVIVNWGQDTPPIINIMFHSVEVIPGASPYAQDKNDVSTLVQSLELLFRHLSTRYQLESIGLSELAALYRGMA